MDPQKPIFTISLDFELYWGMIDKVSLAEYGERLKGVREAIPRILTLFEEYGLHATWATVGMLMHDDKESLLRSLPEERLRPTYKNPALSTYSYIEKAEIGKDEEEDPYHFGASLVRKIQATPDQEIASHTFSHYYCVDGSGNSDEIFDTDCRAFNKTAERFGITPRSIIFPRNQAYTSALTVCKANGITAYRGNEDHYLYRPRRDEDQSLLIRGLRLADHYVNMTGHHGYKLREVTTDPIVNLPASRFLRPYSRVLRFLEPLRLERIKRSMTHAAVCGEIYHLWWHPHNFGLDLNQNMRNLRKIAEHFTMLKKRNGMESLTLSELASRAQSI